MTKYTSLSSSANGALDLSFRCLGSNVQAEKRLTKIGRILEDLQIMISAVVLKTLSKQISPGEPIYISFACYPTEPNTCRIAVVTRYPPHSLRGYILCCQQLTYNDI